MVDTNTIDLHMFTVKEESFLGIEFERTDTNRCVVGINNLIVYLDDALHLIHIWVFNAPKGWIGYCNFLRNFFLIVRFQIDS